MLTGNKAKDIVAWGRTQNSINHFVKKKYDSCQATGSYFQTQRHIETLKQYIIQSSVNCNNAFNSTVCLVDLDEVERRHEMFREHLPRVKPYYAVKCNSDQKLLKFMKNNLKLNFDCASPNEIKMINQQDNGNHNNFHSDIIYANPVKAISHLTFAASSNVKKVTVDSVEELRKIKEFHPNSECLIRLLVDDSNSDCRLGQKYGASLEEVNILMREAKKINLKVTGVAFHVGSGGNLDNSKVFRDSIRLARKAFDIGFDAGHHTINVLDIGRGFPGKIEHDDVFKEMAKHIRNETDRLFPSEVEIIAEPGRFYVTSSHTLGVNVIGIKETQHYNSNEHHKYYLSDGIYGTFNSILHDHAIVEPNVLISKRNNMAESERVISSLWGPTCDGLDCVIKTTGKLPLLDIGDWLYFENMGAYTVSAASRFNGFETPQMLYLFNDELI